MDIQNNRGGGSYNRHAHAQVGKHYNTLYIKMQRPEAANTAVLV